MEDKYIKILENFIQKPVRSKNFNKISNKEIQAIQDLLQAYKEKEEIIKTMARVICVFVPASYYNYITPVIDEEFVEEYFIDEVRGSNNE